VKATLRQPRRTAASAICRGVAISHSSSTSRALLICQFWQKRHPRLQPAVPKDSTLVPGRKWFKGFFSMGSTHRPVLRP